MAKTTKTTRTADGRAVVEVTEGGVETRMLGVQDVGGCSDWTTVFDTNVGDFSNGTVTLAAQVRGNGSAEWTAIEVKAVGYLGSAPSILWAGMLGGSKNTAIFPLAEGRTFDRIAIEARLMVNGAAGAGALTPSQASLSATLKLWG